MNLDESYSFTVNEKISRDYKFASEITSWIKENLENLRDDNNQKLFNKVNLGYNEDNLRGFGTKPVCDVHLGQIEYDEDLQDRTPRRARSIVIFYLKGSNDVAYAKCCDVHDYLMQEFITNSSFRELDDIVMDTYIIDSELMNQPINKKWGVMGALELAHLLY